MLANSPEDGKEITQESVLNSPTELIATAVHELKTPLTLISGLASVLKDGGYGKVSPQQKKQLARIGTSSDRMLKVVDSILDLERIKQGRYIAAQQLVSVKKIIKEVLHELQPRIRERGHTVDVRISSKFPLIIADETQVYQIIFNLLDNAIKYSEDKQAVIIKGEADSASMRLHVRDFGVGVSKSDMKVLFSKFGNCKQPVAGHAGSSGLGLYIAHNLAKAMNGEVGVKAMPEGSCFHLSLPIVQQTSLFEGRTLKRGKDAK